MRLLIALFIATTIINTNNAQILHTKKIKNAVFTNYHNQLLKPKLQKEFSSPESVLQHIMTSKNVKQLSKIVEGEKLTESDILKVYFNSLFVYKDFSYGNNYSAKLDHSINFQLNGHEYFILSFYLLQNKVPLIKPENSKSILILKKSHNKWYITKDSEVYGKNQTTDIYRIIKFLGYIKSGKLEKMLSQNEFKNNHYFKEFKKYVYSEKGICISKMNDLVLYWGAIEGQKKIENLFNYYPMFNFKGWTGPLAEQWFDNRNIKSYVNYKK